MLRVVAIGSVGPFPELRKVKYSLKIFIGKYMSLTINQALYCRMFRLVLIAIRCLWIPLASAKSHGEDDVNILPVMLACLKF